MRAGLFRAPDQIDADLMVVARNPIKLEPEHVACDLADPLDRAATDAAQPCRGCARAARPLPSMNSAPGQIMLGNPIGATPIGAA